MSDDAVLLRRYATSGDETAFRQVVERHLSMVYASALRQVGGDRLLAEDVTQNVFYDLARHAAEFEEKALVGHWLYRATRFAAAHAVRSEQRRRTRENVYARDMVATDDISAPATVGEPVAWDAAGAHLDDAVNELPKADRDAILLRYFQGLDLRAVGDALQTSGNTAQKRVSRALERLRTLLVQRGVALSVTALAAFLTKQATTVPPPVLVEAIIREAGEVTALAQRGLGAAPTTSPLFTAGNVAAAAAVVLGGVLCFSLWRTFIAADGHSTTPPGLISWWQGEGRTDDATGRNPAYIQGNVTFVPGLVGQAFHFDGQDGTCLTVNDSPSLNLTNDLTVGFWFRPDDDSAMGSLLAKRGPGGPRAIDATINYQLQLNPAHSPVQWGIAMIYNDITVEGGYHLSDRADGTNYFVSHPNKLEQLAFFPSEQHSLDALRGQWHHLTATYRQRENRRVELAVYFDGAGRGRYIVAGTLANAASADPLLIGGFSTVWFKGSMDEIQMYDRVLTDREIQRIATRPPTPALQTRR